jgi:hypothetical protein
VNPVLGARGHRLRDKKNSAPQKMPRCAGIECRNRGSGYVKSDADSDSARELAKRMADLQAAREAQDAKIWGPSPAIPSKLGAPVNKVIYVPPRTPFQS